MKKKSRISEKVNTTLIGMWLGAMMFIPVFPVTYAMVLLIVAVVVLAVQDRDDRDE